MACTPYHVSSRRSRFSFSLTLSLGRTPSSAGERMSQSCPDSLGIGLPMTGEETVSTGF